MSGIYDTLEQDRLEEERRRLRLEEELQDEERERLNRQPTPADGGVTQGDSHRYAPDTESATPGLHDAETEANPPVGASKKAGSSGASKGARAVLAFLFALAAFPGWQMYQRSKAPVSVPVSAPAVAPSTVLTDPAAIRTDKLTSIDPVDAATERTADGVTSIDPADSATERTADGVASIDPVDAATEHVADGVASIDPADPATERTADGVASIAPADAATERTADGVTSIDPADPATERTADGVAPLDPVGQLPGPAAIRSADEATAKPAGADIAAPTASTPALGADPTPAQVHPDVLLRLDRIEALLTEIRDRASVTPAAHFTAAPQRTAPRRPYHPPGARTPTAAIVKDVPRPALDGQLLAVDLWDGAPSVVVGTGLPGHTRVRVLKQGDAYNGVSLKSVDPEAKTATFAVEDGRSFTLSVSQGG